MRPGPAAAVAALDEVVTVASPPVPALELLVAISLKKGWHTSDDLAREAAAGWEARFLSRLRDEHAEYASRGRFVVYAFNSSSPEYIQGCAYVEPSDDDDTKKAKQLRAVFDDYVTAIAGLTPRDFETLCKGILALWEVEDPQVSQYSGDEGIDFYGRLRLERHLASDKPFPGVERQLTVWMVGQAKHYKKGKVSTPEIRDLVGAVALARAHAFGGAGDKYEDLHLRVCDPVFYLFFTTGPMSLDTWRLLDRSGVIGMDGQMLAAFLADHGVGIKGDVFDADTFATWIGAA